MSTTLSAALASFKTATDFVKSAFTARDETLISKAIRDVNDRFIDVQTACVALQEQNLSMCDEMRTLKEKLQQCEQLCADLENFELYQTGRGATAYRHKTAVRAAQDPVYLCANCVSNGVKTFLQPVVNGYFLECHIHGRIASDVFD